MRGQFQSATKMRNVEDRQSRDMSRLLRVSRCFTVRFHGRNRDAHLLAPDAYLYL